jgi:hypothetical protein
MEHADGGVGNDDSVVAAGVADGSDEIARLVKD